MKYLIVFVFTTLPFISFSNDFAKSLVESFENSKCKLSEPVSFANTVPHKDTESCHIFDETLYLENIIGNHAIDALRDHKINRVVLNSVGGSIQAASIIAKLIREYRIDTFIPEGGHCASSCTLVFQAGINRVAHTSAKLLYHCVGNNGLSLILFKQSCSSDLSSLTDECKENLEKQVTESTLETERHFKKYSLYGAKDLFTLLVEQSDYKNWFKTGNFCKKRAIFSPEQVLNNQVVTEILE